MRDRKINHEILLELGFTDIKKTHGSSPIYRKKIDNYPWELQFVLGDYPDSNPNCGILGVYHSEEDVKAIPLDLYKKRRMD